jgi:hypothetical protein
VWAFVNPVQDESLGGAVGDVGGTIGEAGIWTFKLAGPLIVGEGAAAITVAEGSTIIAVAGLGLIVVGTAIIITGIVLIVTREC